MTKREIVEKILAYHPNLPDYHGCDDWKCGNPDEECTGVVTALVPNMQVIRKAIELGANLIIVHEPTFYTSADEAGWFEDFPCSVYEEKRKLLDDHHICIWRDHDHMHFHRPDGIFTGVLKYLGWENCSEVDTNTGSFAHFHVHFPEMSVEDLCKYLIEKIGMNGVRYIGNPDAKVSSLAFVGHLFPGPCRKTRKDGTPMEYGASIIKDLEERVDVILPGEIIDWTVAAYVRDAALQGKNKAMINLGHMNWEELGMKYAEDWVGDLIDHQLPVTYVPSGDMYDFVLA